MLAVYLLGNRVFQTIKVFKAKTCRQRIVNAGIGFFVKFVDLDLKNSQFTGQMRCLILLGECHGNINCCPRLRANQPVFKARDKAV